MNPINAILLAVAAFIPFHSAITVIAPASVAANTVITVRSTDAVPGSTVTYSLKNFDNTITYLTVSATAGTSAFLSSQGLIGKYNVFADDGTTSDFVEVYIHSADDHMNPVYSYKQPHHHTDDSEGSVSGSRVDLQSGSTGTGRGANTGRIPDGPVQKNGKVRRKLIRREA